MQHSKKDDNLIAGVHVYGCNQNGQLKLDEMVGSTLKQTDNKLRKNIFPASRHSYASMGANGVTTSNFIGKFYGLSCYNNDGQLIHEYLPYAKNSLAFIRDKAITTETALIQIEGEAVDVIR